jgi:phenylalanine-4-hydroxylase
MVKHYSILCKNESRKKGFKIVWFHGLFGTPYLYKRLKNENYPILSYIDTANELKFSIEWIGGLYCVKVKKFFY